QRGEHLDGFSRPDRRARAAAHRTEEKQPDVTHADEKGDDMPRTSRAPDQRDDAVSCARPDEIRERVHVTGAAPESPVRARKMSSSERPASAGCAAMISSSVPYAAQLPRLSTRSLVQSSSTRLSRWELRMTAAPIFARAVIVAR